MGKKLDWEREWFKPLHIFKACFASGSALGRVLGVQVMLGVWRERNAVVIQPLGATSLFQTFPSHICGFDLGWKEWDASYLLVVCKK